MQNILVKLILSYHYTNIRYKGLVVVHVLPIKSFFRLKCFNEDSNKEIYEY